MEPYVLGHTSRELERLDLQGQIYRDATRRALLDGGLRPGMKVLDIGCGSGDVTRLGAELVGPTGSVLGIDRERETITVAQARSAEGGVLNTEFRLGEVGDDVEARSFDALIGRFVLMHQSDPSRVLKNAAAAVRSNGPIVMVESHMAALLGGGHSQPHSELYDNLVRWKCAVVEAAGADIHAGLRLRRTFEQAGLPAPEMRMEAVVTGGTASPYYGYMAESVRSMLPQARALGVGGMDEDAVDRIEARLFEELVESGGTLTVWPVVAAWSRVPTIAD